MSIFNMHRRNCINFFSPWIFEFMLYGDANVLDSLPKVMVDDSVARKLYNQVSFFGMICISCKTVLDFFAYLDVISTPDDNTDV